MNYDQPHMHQDDLYPELSDSHISVTEAGKFLISDLGQLRHMEFLFCTSAAAVVVGAAAYGVYAVAAAERKTAEEGRDAPCSDVSASETLTSPRESISR